MSLEEDLRRKPNKNWLKAAFALKCLKEGIEPFVSSQINQQHAKILVGLQHSCNSCSIDTLLPPHALKVGLTCAKGRQRCLCIGSKRIIRNACPNKICGTIYDRIVDSCAFCHPFWNNTDISKWTIDSWEIAKCYINIPGYQDRASAHDTDCLGLLTIIINNMDIWNDISTGVDNKTDVFSKVKHARNQIMHSPTLEVTDSQLNDYVKDMITILEDPKQLISDKTAVSAKTKLQKILQDDIYISTKDEIQLREEALKAIEEETKESVRQISDMKSETLEEMNEIKNKHSTELSSILQNQTDITADIQSLRTSIIYARDDQSTLKESIIKIQSDQETIEGRQAHMEKRVKSIEDTCLKKVENTRNPEYLQKKQELKEDLAEFHRDRHSTIPLSPLFEEKDTPLLDFYLMPKNAFQSLSEVHKSGDNFSKEIYVTADAGFGKTAFSKYLTVLWCQAHFPDKKHTKHLEEKSVNAMRKFEFIFLVLLRESSDDCSIDDLIFNHVIQNMSHSKSYNEQFLQEILHRERCLVVLDGLDEWTHPLKCAKLPKSIPHRNSHKNCTYLTTTRPWKLSTTQLNTKQLDKTIKLTNLDSDSALELTTRALKKLKGKPDLEMKNEAKRLLERYHDFEQVSVPLLLMYIICLWCDDIPVGHTKCGLYTSIFELLLSRTISKYEKFYRAGPPQCNSDILQCFSEQEHCKAYFTFLTSLGELAFQTLFRETSENRLVFDSSIADKCLKEDFLELGRLTGIITQHKQSKLTSQIRKTSFSHKTVQEFFAALFISTCSDQDKVLTKVLSLCDSIYDILDLSKVFIFMSGINAETFSLLSYKLMKVINKDEKTREYRSGKEYTLDHPLRKIQDMFVSCITEIPDKQKVNICLQYFFFDYKCNQNNYYTNLQRLAVNNKTNITSISICIIGEAIQSLSAIIDSFELSDLKNCLKIFCKHKCKEEDIFHLLSTSVKRLEIWDEQEDKENKDSRSCLTDEQCKTFHNSSQLERIYIGRSRVSHKFLNYIVNVRSIKQITLYRLSCSEHVRSCPGFKFDLSQHPELRELKLSDSYQSNFTLCDMNEDESLHNMRNIEYVQLWEMEISSLFLRRLVKIIKQLEQSVSVELQTCRITPGEDFLDIKDYIRRSENFVVEEDFSRYRDEYCFRFVTKK